MSLYNLLFGTNQDAGELLRMLNLTTNDFGRFRDAYLNEDGTKIIVLTRCGGGNREDYQHVFADIAEHDEFITEYDDDFDCTYAYFEFRVPEKFAKQAKFMITDDKPKNVHEKFVEATDDIKKNGKDSKYAKKMEPILNKIKEASDDKNNKGGVILV